jgi:hypothetical protein
VNASASKPGIGGTSFSALRKASYPHLITDGIIGKWAMMLSAQAAPAGPAGIALLGVRNRLHFTLTALANWHQPFRGRPLGEVKTQLSSYFFLLLFFFRSMSLPFVFRGARY